MFPAPVNRYSGNGVYGTDVLNAKTSINELGDVFKNLFGSFTTSIVNDAGSSATGYVNSDLAMISCFGFTGPVGVH